MSELLAAELSRLLGAAPRRLSAVAGGDINQAYAAELEGGARVFVKTHPAPPAGMYAREAEGLAWLAQAGALRVPEVLAVGPLALVLGFIEARPRRGDFDELLGRGLALLHRCRAPSFGLTCPNFIGSLPQDNTPAARFSDFYAQRRLLPLARRALAQRLLAAADCARLEALCAQLPALCGAAEPPARLHGDLWSGNVMGDERGLPVLIDPAVYGGDREVDLAMLCLFGAPSERFFAAYDEVYPRRAGWLARRSLYQLYPLLVHVCLFGPSYLPQLLRTLASAEALQAC